MRYANVHWSGEQTNWKSGIHDDSENSHGCIQKQWVSPHFTPQNLFIFNRKNPHGNCWGIHHHFRKHVPHVFHPKSWNRSRVDDVPFSKEVMFSFQQFISRVCTPFSTNMAPANRPGPKRKLIFQSSISGAMLVSGSVFFSCDSPNHGYVVWKKNTMLFRPWERLAELSLPQMC